MLLFCYARPRYEVQCCGAGLLGTCRRFNGWPKPLWEPMPLGANFLRRKEGRGPSRPPAAFDDATLATGGRWPLGPAATDRPGSVYIAAHPGPSAAGRPLRRHLLTFAA